MGTAAGPRWPTEPRGGGTLRARTRKIKDSRASSAFGSLKSRFRISLSYLSSLGLCAEYGFEQYADVVGAINTTKAGHTPG